MREYFHDEWILNDIDFKILNSTADYFNPDAIHNILIFSATMKLVSSLLFHYWNFYFEKGKK